MEDAAASPNGLLSSIFGFGTSDIDDDDSNNGEQQVAGSSSASALTAVRDQLADVGGGRGVFALRALPAGVLVVSEVPMVTWSDGDLSDPAFLASVVEACCCNEDAYAVTQALHPRLFAECDAYELTKARELLPEPLQAGIAAKAGWGDRDISEVVRVALVLQHNGFGSGLYRSLTMLNHSCVPNAIKYSPSPGSLGASEIWTVRPVAAGEELTISYCEPLEVTKPSMQEFLETHHRFRCRCSSCAVADAPVPAAFSATSDEIAQQEGRVQELVMGMETEVCSGWTGLDETPPAHIQAPPCPHLQVKFWAAVRDIDGVVENLTKLLHSTTGMAAVESGREDFSLSPKVLARVHRLAADAAAAFLDVAGQYHNHPKRPKRELLKSAAFSFLRNSLCLLAQQLQYLGPRHPDVARTHFDVAEALDCALNTFPDDLLAACNARGGDSATHFPELKLLRFPAAADVAKKDVRAEAKRFRALGAAVKRLYTRSLFPGLYRDLQGSQPGACHWGTHVPPEHDQDHD